MGDSLPWTPMNHSAKFDAASFILGGEIRNHTKKTTKQTKLQTGTDISTPCLLANVDNKGITIVLRIVGAGGDFHLLRQW